VARTIALSATELMKSLESASERADRISMFATYFRDPSLLNVQLEKYRGVTARAVTDYARKYLSPENRAKLLYVPADSEPQTGQPS